MKAGPRACFFLIPALLTSGAWIPPSALTGLVLIGTDMRSLSD